MCPTAPPAQTFRASLDLGSTGGGDGLGIIPEGTLSLTSWLAHLAHEKNEPFVLLPLWTSMSVTCEPLRTCYLWWAPWQCVTGCAIAVYGKHTGHHGLTRITNVGLQCWWLDSQQLCSESGGQSTSILMWLNLVIIACFSDDKAYCEYPSLYYAYCWYLICIKLNLGLFIRLNFATWISNTCHESDLGCGGKKLGIGPPLYMSSRVIFCCAFQIFCFYFLTLSC